MPREYPPPQSVRELTRCRYSRSGFVRSVAVSCTRDNSRQSPSPSTRARHVVKIRGKEARHSLLPSNAVTAHALSRLRDLGQQVLSCEVARSDNTSSDRKALAIAPEPALRSTDHGGAERVGGGLLDVGGSSVHRMKSTKINEAESSKGRITGKGQEGAWVIGRGDGKHGRGTRVPGAASAKERSSK